MANLKSKSKKGASNPKPSSNGNISKSKKTEKSSKIIHIHNYKNSKKISKSSVNRVTQTPKAGIFNGFPKILTDKFIQTDDASDEEQQLKIIIPTKHQSDEFKKLPLDQKFKHIFVSLEGSTIARDIKNLLKAKSESEIEIARKRLQDLFGDNFRCAEDFKNAIQFRFLSFEFFIWKHYLESQLITEDFAITTFTNDFISKFFNRGS